MNKELQTAIDRLRAVEQPLALHLLHYDVHLRAFCATWPTLKVETLGPRPFALNPKNDSVVDLRIAVWTAAHVDRGSVVAQARRALGPSFPCGLKYDQAAAGNLVLPDGSLHPRVAEYLEAREQAKLRPMESQRESDGPEGSQDPDPDSPPEGTGKRGLRLLPGSSTSAQAARSATQPDRPGDRTPGTPATRRRDARRARAKTAERGER